MTIPRFVLTAALALVLAGAAHATAIAPNSNLAGTVLGLAARFGDETRYQTWVETYKARKEAGAPPQTVLRYLYTLSDFRPEALTFRTLGLVSDGAVPQEAVSPVMGQLLGQRHSQERIYETPEMAGVASPCYFKMEPGPGLVMYMPWGTSEDGLAELARDKIRSVKKIIELIGEVQPGLKVSEHGAKDLRVPLPG